MFKLKLQLTEADCSSNLRN